VFKDSISDKPISGTLLHPPDLPIEAQCEMHELDISFDVWARRRADEIEALIRADEKLDAEWLSTMRAKADALAGIIRTENWTPKPVSINAPVQVIARDRLRRDKLAGIEPDQELKKIARGTK
jgi:hypothetical protein